MAKIKKSKFSKIIRRFSLNLESIIGLLKTVLTDRQFLYFSAIIVGIGSALAVTVLKLFAHNVFHFTIYLNKLLKLPYINSLLPILGIVLTVLVVKNVLKGTIEKGTAQIMIAVAKKSGIMPRKQMYAQIITSSLTVGMGGSAGLESPITITGAALGSNYSQVFRLGYKDRTLLLACGVAAGIATAFNAPIAGVLFAIEVILADMSVSAFIPLMIASATGAIVANITLNEGILLSFKGGLFFDFKNTPYYILLGIVAGFLSIYHARLFRKIEHKIGSYSSNIYKRALVGSGILALIIFLFPPLFGEGYENIKILANDSSAILLDNSLFEQFRDNQLFILLFIFIIMLVKSVATGLTLGSGGNGGNFAPSLFVGSYLGFIIAKIISMTGLKNLPIDNFTVVGMAALLSGLFHAPLTAIFLIAEITGGYGLIIPLMIVSSISFAISKRYDKYSMDIYSIAEKGTVFTSDKDRNILNKIDINSLYIDALITLPSSLTKHDLIQSFVKCNQNFIPVVNDSKQVVHGVISFDDVKDVLFSSGSFNLDKYLKKPNILNIEDGALKMIKVMEDSKDDYVIIKRNGEIVGYITKAILMDSYRKNLRNLRIE